MKKLTLVVVVALLVAMLVAPGALAAEELTYSTKSAGSVQDQAMDLFAKRVEELTEGRIVGKKYIAGTIGGEEELAEAVSLGDLGATYAADVLIGNIADGCLGWLSMPGLVTSYDEVEKNIFARDGWISQKIDEIMADRLGLKRVASGDNCFRALGVNKEIKTAADLSGVKIRCGNSWENLQLFERAGAISVVVASSETLAAIEQKTVDGAENGILNFQSSGIHDAVSFVLPVNMMYSPCSIVVNLDWYNGLSDEDRTAVDTAAAEASAFEVTETRNQIDNLINTQVESGKWTMLEMNEELTATFKTAADSMWEDGRELYGDEIIDWLLANKN